MAAAVVILLAALAVALDLRLLRPSPGWSVDGARTIIAREADLLILDDGAYDLGSGERLWSARDGVVIAYDNAPDRSAAIVAEQGGRLVSRSIDDDVVNWETPMPSGGSTAPAIIGPDRVYVGDSAIDLASGAVAWTAPFGVLTVAGSGQAADASQAGLTGAVFDGDYLLAYDPGPGPLSDRTIRPRAAVVRADDGAVIARPAVESRVVLLGRRLLVSRRGGDEVESRSLPDDRALWTRKVPHDSLSLDRPAPIVALLGSPGATRELFDLATGDLAARRPPGGWRPGRPQKLTDGWVAVRREDHAGLWSPSERRMVDLGVTRGNPSEVATTGQAVAAAVQTRTRLGFSQQRIVAVSSTGHRVEMRAPDDDSDVRTRIVVALDVLAVVHGDATRIVDLRGRGFG